MILGYISAVIGVFLLLKVVARKSGNQKMNQFFRKIHKPLGIVLIGAILIHLVVTIPVWDTRAVSVIVTGFVATIGIIGMAVLYLMRKKSPKTWFRYHRIGAALFVLMLGLHMITYFVDFGAYQSTMKEISLAGMDASGIVDGSYIGEFDAGYIHVKAEVIVKGEKIDQILLLEHDNERGKKAEPIVDEMVKEQTTDVDAVSGATNSSRVIKKAVENALSGQNKE